MTYSEIEITFDDDVALNDYVNFRAATSGGLFINIVEQWKTLRSNPNQVTVGTPTATAGERSAINFVAAFNLDYNSTSLYVVERVVNVVTIKCTSPIFDFDFVGIAHTNSADVSFDITNYSGTALTIDDVEFIEATTNPVCTHYKVSVTTSVLATTISAPISVTGNTDNPFTFEMPRDVGFSIVCQDDFGQLATRVFSYNEVPKTLNQSNVQLQVSNSPSGGTVIAVSSISGLEYSLDNSTWQTSNVFAGLVEDDYTMYIRDAYGCSFSLDFTISAINIVEPFLYISKSNAIRFAERVTVDNCSTYNNDENTLSGEAYAIDPNLAYCEHQLFKSCFLPTTQFVSNYSTISAVVVNSDGSEDALVVNKLTANIGRKDSRDALSYDLGNGQTGIYFTSGNIYDHDTDLDTGDDYTLNGSLPEYARIGNYISISSAWYEIVNIIFDESKNAEVLVIESVYSGGLSTPVIVKSQYNRQPYEVYEFLVNMALYLDETIQVKITNEDSNYDTRIHLSEKIDVKETFEDTTDIEYYNKKNTDVFYATGIRHKICVPLASKGGDHEGESENIKGDNSANLISSTLYELTDFEFGPVTKEIYTKIAQALSHKYVKIDGVDYILNGSLEKEGPLEESNLYLIKAKMIKTNNVEKSQIIGVEPELSDGAIEVPNLTITGDGEFISYE